MFDELLTEDVGIFVENVEKLIQNLEVKCWRQQTAIPFPLFVYFFLYEDEFIQIRSFKMK